MKEWWPDRIVALLAVIIAIAVLWFGVIAAYRPQPPVIEGMVDATQIDVASKTAGRVTHVNARLGDRVTAGQILFRLDSPEARALLESAQGSQRTADAVAQRARNGPRPQTVAAARAEWESAASAAALAQTTYRRTQALYVQDVTSKQARDSALTAADVSAHQAQAARQAYELALAGTRPEDIETATGGVQTAQGAVALAKNGENEALIRAPISGEIASVQTHAGELAPQGYPVMTILDLQDLWIAFNVREDQLAAFAKGSELRVRIPALGGDSIRVRIYYQAPLGTFATDRSTRTTTGDDLRTFEVRGRPLARMHDLRPGMSAVVIR